MTRNMHIQIHQFNKNCENATRHDQKLSIQLFTNQRFVRYVLPLLASVTSYL